LIAEGIVPPLSPGWGYRLAIHNAFVELWDSINAKRGYSWDSNPWVWVIEWELLECRP